MASNNSWQLLMHWHFLKKFLKITSLFECWMFLKKWNNETTVILFPHIILTPPIEVYPSTNARKNFAPTKFWEIFKSSPPIIIFWGESGAGAETMVKLFDFHKKEQGVYLNYHKLFRLNLSFIMLINVQTYFIKIFKVCFVIFQNYE